MKTFFLFIYIFGSTFPSQATIEYRKAGIDKAGNYLRSGIFAGGEDIGANSSLLGLRRNFYKKNKVERIVFDLGDETGRPLLNRVSYFHVSVENEGQRIVVDLEKMGELKIAPEKLIKKLQRSPIVAKVNVNSDSVSVSTSLEILLKKSVAMEVFKMPSSNRASRLVLDLKVVE